MSFIAYQNKITESKPEHVAIYERYWKLPHEVLKEHNYLYGHWQRDRNDRQFNDRIYIYADDERHIGLLLIHTAIAAGVEHAPAAYVFYAEDELVLLQVTKTSTYLIDIEKKILGRIFELAPFSIPEHFIGRETELKELIKKIFINKEKKEDPPFLFSEIKVIFDQPFEHYAW
ncbi:hypothetical protein OD757_06670 [Acinetobacter sp. AYS6]|uniref:hypothetical protein n=1 Tax=Acinetobacter sp. AYS6 TaxID=2983297 RepID=UPI0021D68E7E|nr:hypothetical protein [Acinetobacter sp. AYS6]MCU7696901.1 hypothetical protein [Acinetobacter sp. AYS6]